jgi:hypothetical protein
MNTAKIKTTSKLSDVNLKRKAQSIVLAMTGNSNFTEPVPALAQISETISQYSNALAAALEGGRAQKSEKNKVRSVLEDQLRQLAAYVMLTAHTDRSVLASSGFDLSKISDQSHPVDAPQNPMAESGVNSGEVLLTVKGVKNKRTYSHEYAQDPLTDSSTWTVELDTIRKHLFTGLVPGKKYWFRVASVGLRGKKNYSNEISCYVQ